MKIVLDARRLLHIEDPTWPRYVGRLVSGLQSVDRTNEYVLLFNFFRKRYKDILGQLRFNENVHPRTLRLPHRVAEYLFEDLHLPIEIAVGRADVVHGPVYSLFNSIRGRSIVTIHDLIFIKDPDVASPFWVRIAKKHTDYAVKRADVITTISHFVKGELIDYYRIPEEKIRVIYNGIDRLFSPRSEGIGEVKQKYGIKGNYVLFVGAIEPRKNLSTLLEAYGALRDATKREYRLVVTGVRRHGSEGVFEKLRKLRLEDNVTFTGMVTDEDLPKLYSGAALFIFPSLMEGFGMPPLEAMACGTPVIASNMTAVPEVVGDAALLIDPRNPDDIGRAIETVLSDGSLREELRRKGIARARSFSWEQTARDTVRLYQEVC